MQLLFIKNGKSGGKTEQQPSVSQSVCRRSLSEKRDLRFLDLVLTNKKKRRIWKVEKTKLFNVRSAPEEQINF